MLSVKSKRELFMLKKLQVQNFKSILSDTIELGQLNVFIGENGAGKSNLLEALAVMSAAKQERLDIEGLYSKGVRVAKPELTFSSFHSKKPKPQIEISVAFQREKQLMTIKSVLETDMTDEAVVKWKDSFEQQAQEQEQQDILKHVLNISAYEDKVKLMKALSEQRRTEKSALYHPIQNYLIYNLNTKALRGLSSESKKVPLGINGEGLDILLANFSELEFTQLQEYAYFVNWLDEIVIDTEDLMKFSDLKQGKSISKLYFKDKFMMKKENIFSAENANEGVLHILFYLALFISRRTPTLFAIDNIESHLNPHLCTELTRVICKLAKKTNKQTLITTHNPAILDGLNLNDDDIRLFEIYRNDEGHTKTRRIQLNPETKPVKAKLSELWMRGYLGAISKQF
ncbi:MAG: recombinase RecF [Candidatus Parabeggiatoa sp. nov. 1]|nr:MAG: recombinase RecF [Gammaproteobacteria bacterium]